MDCKDIMIGDWVLLDGVPKRLTLWDIVEISRGNYEAEPIPLTTDIMNANGRNDYFATLDFKDYEVESRYSAEGGMYVCIKEYFDEYMNPLVLFEHTIEYVHQLQIALRVCELNELADNFKVA